MVKVRCNIQKQIKRQPFYWTQKISASIGHPWALAQNVFIVITPQMTLQALLRTLFTTILLALCMQLLFCIMHYLKWYKNILLKNKPLVLCLTPGLQNVMSWIIHMIRFNVIIFSPALSLCEWLSYAATVLKNLILGGETPGINWQWIRLVVTLEKKLQFNLWSSVHPNSKEHLSAPQNEPTLEIYRNIDLNI